MQSRQPLSFGGASRKLLPSCFIVALAVFALANLLVASRLGVNETKLSPELFSEKEYHRPFYGSWSWWIAKNYVDQGRAPDIVLLGSSQINSAMLSADAHELQEVVDTLMHRRVNLLERRLKDKCGHIQVFNCAINGAVASDYYMVSRALFTGYAKPKIVIIGVSPRDFIDNKLPMCSVTEPYKFFSQFTDIGKLMSLAYPDPLARANAQIEMAFNKMPMRQVHDWIEQYRVTTQAKAPQTKKGNELLAAVWNAAQVVKPGEWMVPANMGPIFVDNSFDYILRYRNPNPPSYPIQLSFFDELLAWLRREDVKVLVVGMPTLPENRALLSPEFWSNYRMTMQSLCKKNGAYWHDDSNCDDFVKANYVDTVHLNAEGGGKIIEVFETQITNTKELLAALQNKSSTGIAARP